jgi:hypothetical protein
MPRSFPLFFASSISIKALNLRDSDAIWRTHLLSFVPFTLTQHLIEV